MHKDYSAFSEEDFIADEYFHQWVKTPDAENNQFWSAWVDAHPEKRGAVMAARTFIENLSFQVTLPSQQKIEASLSESLLKIEAMEAEVPVPRQKKYRFRRMGWLAAAAFVGCLVVAGLLYKKAEPVTIHLVAGQQEIKTITLPDSSVVTLNAGAHLTYTSAMQQSADREVWLDGEAFFSVSHQADKGKAKRFIVHTNDMDIEVLGTTFNVKKMNGVTNVSLNTGKIKIALKNEPETAIYLQPGDFVRYSPAERQMLKKKVSVDLYSGWKENKISVDNMPLSEITRLLEDTYGYDIRLERKELGESKVSGALHVKDEKALIETLAFVLNLNIVKKDSVLFFQSKN
ncbi:MAG TPA: FecR domain-containing protein [Flavisolibacter sp.]|nr:FecR domain-containing protein [Flavisolibacter sp.]